MTVELIHDALNEVDERFITEVDELRGTFKKKKRRWLKLTISAAAALAVIASASAYLMFSRDIPYTEGGGTDAGDYEEYKGEDAKTDDESSEIALGRLLTVKITKLTDNGFEGDSDNKTLGYVTILLDDDSVMGIIAKDGTVRFVKGKTEILNRLSTETAVALESYSTKTNNIHAKTIWLYE